MLTQLYVRNIALIDEVCLTLDNRLNIFSGETGAGKSMLIDSIQFAIGNRIKKQIIRKGENSAYVKLKFEDLHKVALSFLEDVGIPYSQNEIIIERTLYISGKTVYKINGVISNRSTITKVASILIDVHGQHEPQSLLVVSNHIDMLDSFGDAKFISLKNHYDKTYFRWQKLKNKLSETDGDNRKKLQLKDMLSFQINEITMANLKLNEEDELTAQLSTLSQADKIMTALQKTYSLLNGTDDFGALSCVGSSAKSLQDISDINPELQTFYNTLIEIESNLQEVTYNIQNYADNIEYSPRALLAVQTRLDVIYSLKQKYGNNIEEILQYKMQCEKDLYEISQSDIDKESLQKEVSNLEVDLNNLATELYQIRITLAQKLEQQINIHLKDLQMPHALFKVNIQSINNFTKNGHHNIEFLIKTNVGDDFHPLSQIASGGEISRIMLAIKTVLVLGDKIETVIFDEIDTGISGVTATKVAEKLSTISRSRQVICITHLPQIVAMGDENYLIEKNVIHGKTHTSLTKLTSTQIHHELCRLMGGVVTEATLKSAEEIKNLSIKYKDSCQ
ncbi:MAG: DNA repair protein RecN [Epulopiscium sp. Nuni2H_MBin003]|nr:MAG: DNA repair protein RecN [Epulopiscium sp. Nuni2H_MBin003]